MGESSRRHILLGAAIASMASLGRSEEQCSDERRYRIRAESLDELLASAKASIASRKIPQAVYPAVVEWLYEMQSKLYEEVRAHSFADIAEGTYWRRSRLKFPSAIDQEREALKAPPSSPP